MTGESPERLPEQSRINEIQFHEVKMVRNPSPVEDTKSLVAIARLLRKVGPSVFVGATPKASLLGNLAARIAFVPIRVYWVWGLRFETESGIMRFFLRLAERITVGSATHVRPVSPSVHRELTRVAPKANKKLSSYNSLHSNGIDLERFRPATHAGKRNARQRFGLPEDRTIVGFVGRLTPDKGIEYLIQGVEEARKKVPELFCVVVGQLDSAKPISESSFSKLAGEHWMVLGPVRKPEYLYHALDILCTPSLREGLPTVNLEAAASGVPVVTTSATGAIDSILDGVGGLLVRPASGIDIAEAIVAIARGKFGFEQNYAVVSDWLKDNFSEDKVWKQNRQFFDSLVN